MVSTTVIDDFLAQRRLAFVGASHDPKAFSASVYRALKEHGYQLVPVNPSADEVEGDPCVASVRDLPAGIEGAIVMVPPAAALAVVEECIDREIPRVWLHQGAGPTCATPEAVARARDAGLAVVDGACPMMFLDDATWVHRVHRWGRRRAGHLTV